MSSIECCCDHFLFCSCRFLSAAPHTALACGVAFRHRVDLGDLQHVSDIYYQMGISAVQLEKPVDVGKLPCMCQFPTFTSVRTTIRT